MKKLYYSLAILLMVGLTFFSINRDPVIYAWCSKTLIFLGLQTPEIENWVIYHPKLWHVVLYAFLGGAIFAASQRLLLSLLTAFMAGALLEIMQHFVPTREARLNDLVYNFVGILIGLFFVSFCRSLLFRSDQKKQLGR